jgi:TonB family protein
VAMFPDETQSEKHLDRSAPAELPVASLDAEVQRKRMLLALGILLVALVAVIIKDWDFWFPSHGETPEAAAARKAKAIAAEVANPTVPARPERKPEKTTAAPPESQAPFAATAERTALPALEVEVVAGNRHVAVPAKSNAIHLDVGSVATGSGDSGVNMPAPQSAAVATAERVRLSPQTTQNVSVTVPPDYPLLARQMKVQGAVSLQALIARDGTIQELQILSGPEILATAAREAVKQWHFKPYLQNGQPVETQAKITVNFTISTN